VKKLSSTSQYVPAIPILLNDNNYCLHSQVGSSYQIAELGENSELYERLLKYDKRDESLNVCVLNFTLDYFFNMIGSCSQLDKNEAFKELNKSSSTGIGAKLLNIKDRKSDKLETYLDSYYAYCTQSPRSCFITASQKDEIRVVGKTPRLFTSFPVEHTYLCSIALGDFLRQFYSHSFSKDHTVSAVGDSMQNGCLEYYRQELSKRPYLYCTDTSAQDSSVSFDFLNAIYDRIEAKCIFNSNDERNIFYACRFNSIYKVVSVHGLIYLLPRGLGSGDYLTVVVNIMWRLYMVIEKYTHPTIDFFTKNTPIINGDDLVMSSEYSDIDLNSKHAKIEWAGRPVSWDEMDFCSHKFAPYIHQDPVKHRAVVNLRRKRSYGNCPIAEMQRLGGLLHVLSNREMYNLILEKMLALCKDSPQVELAFQSQYITYEQLYANYNCI